MTTTAQKLDLIGLAVIPPKDPWKNVGTVTSVNPLQVAWVGEDDSGAEYPCLDQYVPTVGDSVRALWDGTTWLVIGSIDGGTGANAGTLSGEIKMFASATTPNGWLTCNGAAVSRTTYATLFAVIGTSYGAGDGTTTFNLPDFGSAFPRGNTPGAAGGSATHTHPLSDNGSANVYSAAGTTYFGRIGRNFPYNATFPVSAGTLPTGTSAGSTSLSGATDSASTLPPYTGVNFIIKT